MERSELSFTTDISQTLPYVCAERNIRQAIILVDRNTETACLPLLESSFPVISIPPGELSKNMKSLEMVLDALLAYKADKNTVIFNLGGGVVSDIGGLAASVYRRGLRYVNIPTTLLGMVDAAIGGKTGVDFHNYKNYIGTFYPPEVVLISSQFLDTLPKAEIESAWAEIIKSAVIGSSEIFRLIESGEDLDKIIMETAIFKQDICDRDLRDRNIRQLLNFGHTIGHAYESYRLSTGEPVMHGTAVAKGMLYETGLALKLGLIEVRDADIVCKLVKDKLNCEDLDEAELSSLMPFLQADKKNEDGYIIFSLPIAIGKGKHGIRLTMADLKI